MHFSRALERFDVRTLNTPFSLQGAIRSETICVCYVLLGNITALRRVLIIPALLVRKERYTSFHSIARYMDSSNPAFETTSCSSHLARILEGEYPDGAKDEYIMYSIHLCQASSAEFVPRYVHTSASL